MIRTIGIAIASFLAGGVLLAGATPFPSIEAQFDVTGDCVINFPGDTLLSAKVALGIEPVPTWLPTCQDWYATPTPTETPTP